MRSNDKPGGYLVWVSPVLIVIGGLLLLNGLLFDPSVPGADGGRIINSGQTSMREALLLAGGPLFVSGWMLAAVIKITEVLERSKRG